MSGARQLDSFSRNQNVQSGCRQASARSLQTQHLLCKHNASELIRKQIYLHRRFSSELQALLHALFREQGKSLFAASARGACRFLVCVRHLKGRNVLTALKRTQGAGGFRLWCLMGVLAVCFAHSFLSLRRRKLARLRCCLGGLESFP
jgi:hypothetical protein